jgi:hypothetical protein
MRRQRANAGILRLLGRLLFSVVALVVFILVSVQFARIVNENMAMARTLSSTDSDVATLREHQRRAQRELRRLLDPEGAVPDIHERLRLVRSGEAIIYLQPSPTPDP